MTVVQNTPLSDLPLSWARTDSAAPTFNPVPLSLSGAQWVPLAEIPQAMPFEALVKDHLDQMPNGVVLQSVNVELRDYLIEQGWQAAAMGVEAILDLPWKGKKSVRELARRGRRHGTILEVENNPVNQTKLAQLRRRSPSRQGVELKYTERPAFDDSTRLFVFESAEGQWLGGITLSTNSATSAHTELIIRHKEAPVGIMEALITAITQKLTAEGLTQLSLGSVPPMPTEENKAIFVQHRHPAELWQRSQLMFQANAWMNSVYNAEGLWRFKNKFTPRWEPLYLVSNRRISWLMAAEMVQAIGYLKLVRSSLPSWRPTLPKLQWPRPPFKARAMSQSEA